MDGIFEFKERNVIPIWRDFKRTVRMGELADQVRLSIPGTANIDRAIADWNIMQTIGTAADLVNSAYVAGYFDRKEVEEAIRLIRQDKLSAGKSLIELVEAIENIQTGHEEKAGSVLLEFDTEDVQRIKRVFDGEVFFRIVHRTRELTRSEPRNPIVWVEMARLYSTTNQNDKAELAMNIALQLAPDSRFVLRAATRLFVHLGKAEKALFYLKQSAALEHDPWLLSAHIATSSSIGRFSKLNRQGFTLVESKNYSPFDLTELYSALGTLEFKHGERKKAKGLFNSSLIKPNDNSLAQLRWISHEDHSFDFDPFAFQRVVNPFETYAFEYFNRSQWKDSYDNSIRWLLDTPYSVQPAALASYLATCILYRYEEGIAVCKLGLKVNHKDPVLLNNIVFAYSVTGRPEKAEYYLGQIMGLDWSTLESEQVTMLTATIGLTQMRNGAIALGKEFYFKALTLAKKLPNLYYKYMVIINFTRELLLAKDPDMHEFKKEMDDLKIESHFTDCIFMRREVQKLAVPSSIK